MVAGGRLVDSGEMDTLFKRPGHAVSELWWGGCHAAEDRPSIQS